MLASNRQFDLHAQLLARPHGGAGKAHRPYSALDLLESTHVFALSAEKGVHDEGVSGRLSGACTVWAEMFPKAPQSSPALRARSTRHASRSTWTAMGQRGTPEG